MLVTELIDKLLEVDGDLVVTYDADGRIVRVTGVVEHLGHIVIADWEMLANARD